MININYSFYSKLVIIIIWLLMVTSLSAQEIPKFRIMTEPWMRYQFEKNGKLQGISVDLLELMLERIGSKQNRDDFEIIPWARAYYYAQNYKNTILFSTTRTPEREKMFKWVGPIFTNAMCFIAKKDRHIRIGSPKEAKKFKIGTVIDDVSEQMLVNEGFSLDELQRNTKGEYNLKKLHFDRIDLVIQTLPGFIEGITSLGYASNDYECIFTLNSYDICFSFHKSTSDAIIGKFQETLNQIKSEGKLREFFKTYGFEQP